MMRHRPATQTGDTGMFILLLYHIWDSNIELWIQPGKTRVMKWLPAHLVAKRLPRSELFDILTKNLHKESITGIKARIHAGKLSLLVIII